LESDKQDLFHPTYYDPYFLDHIGKKPFILTVYDLTIEKFDDGSALTQTVLGWKKELISKAEHIISISENTKEDIVSYYGVRPDKITTIYLAAGFDFAIDDNNDTVDGVDKAYILFVGSRNAYKNFNQFVVEVADLLNQYDLQLVVAGGGQLNADEIALLKSLNVYNRVVAVSHVSDQYLAQLYSNAMVFVFPSLYEGFGIPVLEAMQCQCPTLLSNNSSLPEVGESAAQYFDPLTNGDLKKALEQLILNEELRAEMKVKGLEQSKKFSWQNTADKHALVYQRILAHQKTL
jgi:glycosyltransferase involved in cell wall biosynthesis